MELPPMNDYETKLWLADDLIASLAFYCRRTKVPSGIAWSFFVTDPPTMETVP